MKVGEKRISVNRYRIFINQGERMTWSKMGKMDKEKNKNRLVEREVQGAKILPFTNDQK